MAILWGKEVKEYMAWDPETIIAFITAIMSTGLIQMIIDLIISLFPKATPAEISKRAMLVLVPSWLSGHDKARATIQAMVDVEIQRRGPPATA